MIQFKSLTMRIWFILTTVVIVTVVILSLVFAVFLKDANENRHAKILQYAHENIRHALKDETAPPLASFINEEGMFHFTYNQATNNIQFIANIDQHLDEKLLQKMVTQTEHETFSFTNRTFLVKITPIDHQTTLVSYSKLKPETNISQFFIIGFIIILLSLPVAKIIANSIAQPLKKLEAYTAKIANKQWQSELQLKNADEIGRLAQAMNQMKHTLQQADEEEKKFLQSISHDLKTPVMVIMSYAQAIIDGMYVHSPEHEANIIKNEAIRLEKKIKQILYLNTLDYILENETEEEDIYFDKLLSYLVHNMQPIKPNLTWHVNIKTKKAYVFANADRIRVSIENILDNQLRYAKEHIEVTLREEAHHWVIEINNDGPPIPEHHIKQLFSHLFKGEQGNFGLGLAISHKITQHYNGTLQAENKENKVSFTIRYPK